MKLSRALAWVNRRSACAAVVLLGVAAACSGSAGPTAIELNIDQIDVTSPCTVVIEGESCQIVARAFSEGQVIQNPVLRYTSSNSSTASVSTTGVVRGLAPGQATIVVSNSTGSVSDQFNASVLPSGTPK